MLSKYLVFVLKIEPLEQSFLRYIIVGIGFAIFCAIYWGLSQTFESFSLLMGFSSGIFVGIAKVLFTYALNIGPAGGITAISNTSSSVFFTIIMAVRNLKFVRTFELIGGLLSVLGCFLVSVPEKFSEWY